MPVPRTTAQRAIDQLALDGGVERQGRGVRNNPYRFVLTLGSAADGELSAPTIPLNYGLFGDDDEWVTGTA